MMNSLKTVAVVAVLALVAYAVFVVINQPSFKTPPPEAADAKTDVPDVSLPPPGAEGFGAPPGGETASPLPPGQAGMSMSTGDMGSGGPGSPGGMAPPFNPSQQAPPFRRSQDAPPFSRSQDGPPYEAGADAPPYGARAEPPSYRVPAENPPYGSNVEARRFVPSETAYPGPDGVPGRTTAFESGPSAPGAGTYPTAPPPTDIHSRFASFLEDCRRRLDRDEYTMVHLALSDWYNRDGLSEQETAELNDLLDRLAGSIIYGRQDHLLEKPYPVKPGETLDMIAQKYNVPWELLAKINGIRDRSAIQPGQKLKVVRGPFKARIDLSRYELTLFLQGRYAGRFRIGVGREFEINEGLYTVDEKQWNPAYDGAAGFIPPGDPKNPYGGFRILLANHAQTREQFSIHGTSDPRNVGAQPALGSICLGSPDIEDVYDILSVGSEVVIRR